MQNIDKEIEKIKKLKEETQDIGEFIDAEREIKDLEAKKRIMKTVCANCKKSLYKGKFWIYGASRYKYCSKECCMTKKK